ncbi:hypothetical protein SAMN05421504_105464 [Amycolatopsis xylanica]|uniref:CDP-Glycerol:Poly(Glycerophosphate) glycerophosphotransferase n=1 Tax=Amycolatopsis xylanica TaxID=589385 RepID=A0A1H3JLG3_9PSEU|nr:hypothetical protein [Amycolatopsis xylanica]SDY40830.1 hypothetical protein SAMN05421504_105464 [Amycolatopsis xylanica]
MLAIAHNVTAATRLFDALNLLGADDRIGIDFTSTGSSAFDHGTTEFLDARGVKRIAWDQALEREFDLCVSASHGGDLHLLRSPLLIIPHGMGYNKYLARKTENGKRKTVFGLSAEWLLHEGKLIPSTLALSHTEQLHRLERACPEAVPHALIAGDLCLDQLTAAMPLRPSYRRALGVPGSAKLLVVSSTWGPDSLLGRHLELPRRLAETLPVDEYRVAVALHPNIWYRHSVWQVRHWLASCARAGVTVLSDVDDWRAALVAADLIVGDHGSVPFYGAALGLPVLLAAAPEHTVAPDSPIAQLLSAAPRLTTDADLPQRVAAAIEDHDPGKYRTITAQATSVPGRAAALLRTEMYRLMNLPEPSSEAEIPPLPLPARPLTRTASHLVLARLDAERTARLTRFPAERLHSGDDAPRGCHLAVTVHEPRHRWLELADVLIGGLGEDTVHWIADTLRRLPGCALATAPESPGSWLLGDQHGTILEVQGDGALFASVAYQAIAEGSPLASLTGTWQLHTGTDTEVTVAKR